MSTPEEIADTLMQVRSFYFTFGQGQPNAGCYHVIRAFTPAEAFDKMKERFGNQWSTMYPSAEEAGVHRRGLKEIV